MTAKEFYEVIGGDYDRIKANLKTDERIARFAKMFVEDGSYNELESQMKAGNYEAAFQAAHKLKGVCQNLFYTGMHQVVYKITEDLRGQADIDDAVKLLPELEAVYRFTIDNIKLLD